MGLAPAADGEAATPLARGRPRGSLGVSETEGSVHGQNLQAGSKHTARPEPPSTFSCCRSSPASHLRLPRGCRAREGGRAEELGSLQRWSSSCVLPSCPQ